MTESGFRLCVMNGYIQIDYSQHLGMTTFSIFPYSYSLKVFSQIEFFLVNISGGRQLNKVNNAYKHLSS